MALPRPPGLTPRCSYGQRDGEWDPELQKTYTLMNKRDDVVMRRPLLRRRTATAFRRQASRLRRDCLRECRELGAGGNRGPLTTRATISRSGGLSARSAPSRPKGSPGEGPRGLPDAEMWRRKAEERRAVNSGGSSRGSSQVAAPQALESRRVSHGDGRLTGC